MSGEERDEQVGMGMGKVGVSGKGNKEKEQKKGKRCDRSSMQTEQNKNKKTKQNKQTAFCIKKKKVTYLAFTQTCEWYVDATPLPLFRFSLVGNNNNDRQRECRKKGREGTGEDVIEKG